MATIQAQNELPFQEFKNVATPGEYDSFTVLNVLSQNSKSRRYIFDALNCGAKPTNFYGPRDLAIGAVLNVLGRCVKLVDCDGYTKEYYRSNYGLGGYTAQLTVPDLYS
jgi:hypothetical protein